MHQTHPIPEQRLGLVNTTSAPTSSSPHPVLAPRSPVWLDRKEYPWPSHLHDTGVGSMAYIDAGARTSPALIFVHGTPSWSFEWRHQIAAFAPTHRVLAPDHLGFGLSDLPHDGSLAPQDHAHRFLAWLDALDVKDATLVVHDFGGPIGLLAALERAERISRLVIINTWSWSLADRVDVRRMARMIASPLGRLLYLQFNASPRWILPASFGNRRLLRRQIHHHYLAPFQQRARREATWQLGVSLLKSDAYFSMLDTRLSELRTRPAALIWGMKDPAFGRRELERWKNVLPQASVSELPDAGHFPQEEAADQVTTALRDFLSRAN